MRILLVVVAASLAGACVLEEPIGELAGDESIAEFELEDSEAFAEPEIAPAARVVLECQDKYVECMDSKLGDVYDTPNHTRCWYCRSRCEDEGCWPEKTYYGKTCDYSKYKRHPLERRP